MGGPFNILRKNIEEKILALKIKKRNIQTLKDKEKYSGPENWEKKI